MLPRLHSIRARADIDHIFKTDKTIRGSFFFIKYRKNSIGHARLVIIVPRNVTTKAVERNLIRRRITSLFDKKMLTSSIDAAVVALPSILRKPYKEIKEELRKNIHQIFVQ